MQEQVMVMKNLIQPSITNALPVKSIEKSWIRQMLVRFTNHREPWSYKTLETCIWTPPLPLVNSVAVGKCFHLLGLSFLICKTGAWEQHQSVWLQNDEPWSCLWIIRWRLLLTLKITGEGKAWTKCAFKTPVPSPQSWGPLMNMLRIH